MKNSIPSSSPCGLFLAALFCFVSVTSLSAQVFEIRSDPTNGEIRMQYDVDGNPVGFNAPASTAAPLLGAAGSSGFRRLTTIIYMFELPALSAGAFIESAAFSFTHASSHPGGTGPGNIDLYGIGYDNQTRLLNSFWHIGPQDPDEAGFNIPTTFLLQDDIVLSGTSPVEPNRVTTDATGATNLAVFLNALYAAGAQGGDYALLRLSADDSFNPNATILRYHLIGSGTTPDAADPLLSVTVIPEPATIAFLAGLGIIGFVAWRRRRK